MALVDLTLPMSETDAERSERVLAFGAERYCAILHEFHYGSMAGTYIDFPGHIREADDGSDAGNYPLEKLVSIRAAVIHLDRQSGSGGVTAEELAAASPDTTGCGAIVVNALGHRRFDEIECRSVWLATDAARWIAGTGAHLLASDVYERAPELTGIFKDLFQAGVSTVCCPVNLHLLTAPHVELTVLPLRFADVVQLPCRAIARF